MLTDLQSLITSVPEDDHLTMPGSVPLRESLASLSMETPNLNSNGHRRGKSEAGNFYVAGNTKQLISCSLLTEFQIVSPLPPNQLFK